MQNDAPPKKQDGGPRFDRRFMPADACADMAQLRTAVDELDRSLVALLAIRQSYMERAAQLKPRRDQVRDGARVEEVVAHVLAVAARAGLSPAIAEPVWRTLIERCIAYELEAFDRRAAP